MVSSNLARTHRTTVSKWTEVGVEVGGEDKCSLIIITDNSKTKYLFINGGTLTFHKIGLINDKIPDWTCSTWGGSSLPGRQYGGCRLSSLAGQQVHLGGGGKERGERRGTGS